MKSPLEKLRNIGLQKSGPREKWDHKISVHSDGLTEAAKDMKDIRNSYDSLLSAAAATAHSSYEFSESLLEMGNCLLEKIAMHDDGESTEGALSMLGKLQLELQKLVNSYRSHIIMTITNPSESLLSELWKVKALDVIKLDQKVRLIRELEGQILRCVRDQNGNHVVQKCIESIPTDNIHFVISSFRGQVATLSMHPYGCRVIQRFLEHCSDDIQTQFIVDEILGSVYSPAQDQYGNYVTQHVVVRGKPHERSQIMFKVMQFTHHQCQSIGHQILPYQG